MITVHSNPRPDTCSLVLLCTSVDPDPTLSCILCQQDGCEWSIEYQLGGRRIWVGLHERRTNR